MVGFGCPAVAYLIVSIRTFRRERDNLEAGAIFERHWGFNWLTGYCGQEWDQISTDT
jgi:hypothetical protein